jgi:hypothetical protein
MLATGMTVKEVARRFGVSVWCVYDLRLGRTFKHLDRERERIVGEVADRPP